METVKREYYKRLLAAHGGNVTRAAKHAGIHRTTLQRLVRQRSDAADAETNERKPCD